MSAEDYFDWGSAFDQMDDGYCDYPDRSIRPIRGLAPKTCRHCGEVGLYWLKVKGEWKLGKHGEQHVCPPAFPKFEPRKGKLFQ